MPMSSILYICLRSTSTGETRIETAITDSITVEEPSKETLDTKTITTVRSGTVLALISVPVVRSRVNASSTVCFQ